MLMQNFKSAADLGITEPQKEALMKTLVLLETDALTHITTDDSINYSEPSFSGQFNMDAWCLTYDGCGTVACIGGTAELVGNVKFGDHSRLPTALRNLFYPMSCRLEDWGDIIPAQAATALRSYLTTGDARWDLAVA